MIASFCHIYWFWHQSIVMSPNWNLRQLSMNKIRILSHLRLYVYKRRTDFYHQKSLGVLVSNDGVSVSYMLSDKFLQQVDSRYSKIFTWKIVFMIHIWFIYKMTLLCWTAMSLIWNNVPFLFMVSGPAVTNFFISLNSFLNSNP